MLGTTTNASGEVIRLGDWVRWRVDAVVLDDDSPDGPVVVHNLTRLGQVFEVYDDGHCTVTPLAADNRPVALTAAQYRLCWPAVATETAPA
jgi:hypothetical protein